MSVLDDLLIEAENDEVPSSTVTVALAGKLVRLKFRPLGGIQWADITAKSPARPEAPMDRHYGYNWQAAAMKAAPLCGRVLEDDDEVKRDAETWKKLFAKLNGPDVRSICSAIWALNDWDPQQRLEALKKASAGDSEKKPA